MDKIDNFLNSITMYRLVLYGLLVISAFGVLFGFTGILSFSGISLLISAIVLFFVCHFSNILFAKIFKAPINSESSAITALILFLIMSPAANTNEYFILAFAGFAAMASKFLIAPFRKHIFNPAAFGAALIFFLNIGGAIWWVVNKPMLPVTLIVGLLIVRKIRRFDLFGPFLISSIASIIIFSDRLNSSIQDILLSSIFSWPLIFFGTIMLTEPATTPPKKKWRRIYGILVGFLFGSQLQFGRVYATPEIILIIGNIFSYAVGFKERVIFEFREKSLVAKDTFEFIFRAPKKLIFEPGEYMEWTLPHKNPDTRGVRRYFSIASSPTENYIKIGLKTSSPSSSFKSALSNLVPGEKIIAGGLDGDFILPGNKEIKLAFLAGGIGITPFRSMIKYLSDMGEKRDAILFYAARTMEDIAYKEIIEEGEHRFGLKKTYVIGDFLTPETIKKYSKDWHERTYYISGPDPMVRSLKAMLIKMGIKKSKIMTDYFPGYA